MQPNKLTLKAFETMSDNEVAEYVRDNEDADITNLLLLIKEKRAVRSEDRKLLQMVEKSPLTFWASDKAYRVVLWAGKCSDVYNRNLLGKPFLEIMSIYERSNAMKDSISIINANSETIATLLKDFSNYYTKDMEGNARDFSLITNSMQLIDDETGEKFYAEIGLPIDLEQALSQHKERQKEFEKCIHAFEVGVKELKDSFNDEIKEIRKKINNKLKISDSQKRKLKEIVREITTEINDNLSKHKASSDFERFLQDNEEAIEEAIIVVDKAIQNSLSNTPQPDEAKQNKSINAISAKIDKQSEIINITFEQEINSTTSADIDNNLQMLRTKKLTALQDKRDELLRELTEMEESLASSTAYTLRLFQLRLDDTEREMRDFINKVRV